MRLYSDRQHASMDARTCRLTLSQRAAQGGPAERFGVSRRWDITKLATDLPDYACSSKDCPAYRLGPARDAGSVARCFAGPESARRPFSLTFVTKQSPGVVVVGFRPCVLY